MMKKSLSFILALALVLGMTAFAAPSTELYFSLNVDDYATVNDFVNAFTLVSDANVSHGQFDSTGYGATLSAANEYQDVPDATGAMLSGQEKGTQQFTASSMEFETNNLGRKTIKVAGAASAYNKNGIMFFVPKKSWNFLDNQDEIFIISYDYEVNPSGKYSQTMYHSDQTLWTNPEKDITMGLNVMWKTTSAGTFNVGMSANAGKVFSSGALGSTFTAGTTYRVAYGYSYDIGNEYVDNWNAETMNETYYVPTRWYYKDGGNWSTTGNKYFSRLDWGQSKNASNQDVSNHSWNGKPVIYAFSLAWQGDFGSEYSDIIAYTVSADPSTFGAEMVENTVELGDSAVVKFSQPIVPSSATKEAFTMTEDGNAFTAFEIGEVKTFIDEATGEVGTTVEFIFPYGQKADTTYGIDINTTGTMVKSEISRTVAYGNSLTFTTGSAPANIVTLSAKSGLAGDGSDVSALASEQAKFTAVATASDKPSFLFVGIFDSLDNLVSYTYTTATTGDEISLASKVEPGCTVKAFSCGCVYDLTQVFGTDASIN